MAEVAKLNQSATIDYGSYNDVVVVIREWTPLVPVLKEDKYYAPGVGVIKEVEEDEVVELIEFMEG